MKKIQIAVGVMLISFASFALPTKYTDLIPYVQKAPDQGETSTCLFMSTTGAVELLLNKKYDIKYPEVGGRFDISERFTISVPKNCDSKACTGYWHTAALGAFGQGWAIHESKLPYNAYLEDGSPNYEMWWFPRDFYQIPRMQITERFESKTLFVKGGKYATHVLNDADLLKVKKALVEEGSPILINYNDESWWHMILIVGYDDNLKGACYDMEEEDCKGKGAFIVRDSDGTLTHARDYEWFKVKGNAAFVVKLRN